MVLMHVAHVEHKGLTCHARLLPCGCWADCLSLVPGMDNDYLRSAVSVLKYVGSE